MAHTPEESLAARDVVYSEANRNAERVCCVYQCGDETVASFRLGRAAERRSYRHWVASLESAVGTEIQ